MKYYAVEYLGDPGKNTRVLGHSTAVTPADDAHQAVHWSSPSNQWASRVPLTKIKTMIMTKKTNTNTWQAS